MQAIIDRVATHLADIGIKLQCDLNPTATTVVVDAAQKRIGLALPESYIEFITQFANGLRITWNADDGPFASFEMETVESSTRGAMEMRNWRFYDDDAARDYGFPYVDDSDLASATNRLMHNWIPVHAEGNGDNFSINLNPNGFGSVIFDQHDWLDGGTGRNGCLMSSDFPSFFASWGSVCFCPPKSLLWKSVLAENGVNWVCNEFDDRFRLKA